MAFLPPTMVIYTEEPRSHLRYVKESVSVPESKSKGKESSQKSESKVKGLLRIDPKTPIDSPFVRMDVELSKTGKGLVHLRCVYSNKYWRRASKDTWWLVAEAKAPEDDMSSWACTLFRIEEVGENFLRFRHMGTDHYAGTWTGGSPFTGCLYVGPESTRISKFKYVDWDQLLFLPKYVAFKKDKKFLKVTGKKNLEFSGDDFAEEDASFEIITADGGDIYIKHDRKTTEREEFWYHHPSETVLIDCTKSPFRPFLAEKKNDSVVIAIAYFDPSKNDHFYCRPVAAGKKDVYFNWAVGWVSIPYSNHIAADCNRITSETKMEVVERVLRREIYNVDYRQADGRIYNEQIKKSDSQEIKNSGSQPMETTLTFRYTKTEGRKWEHNINTKLGVETTFKGGIPFIAKNETGVSFELGYSFTWGSDESNSEEVSHDTKWVVPPGKKHTVWLTVTVGQFDIPYSYTQRDWLTTGGPPYITVKHDGMFKGINTYNVKCECREENLYG